MPLVLFYSMVMKQEQEESKKNIYITTNVACNLRCTYCYENKIGNDEFDVEQTKQKLFEQLSAPSDESVIVNLHGGEPFLVFSKIKELCEWTWAQDFKTHYVFFATTNGTKVHGVIKDWLYENRHRFVAGLSLDGTREMQNMNRSNSFDLIDIDFFAKTWPNQGVKMTVSPKSIETLADGVMFLHSVGLHNILVNLAYMVDWSAPHFVHVYQRELRRLAKFYKENPDLKKDSIFNLCFPILVSEQGRTRRWCGAGVEMMAYNIDGTQYPCHLFFENVCGKEKSQAWHDIDWANPKEYISEECSKCPLYPTCPTCYGANYIERGSIGSRDMNLCKLEKVRTLEVAKYEYDRIVNSKEDTNSLSVEELQSRRATLEAIEKIVPLLESIEQELKDMNVGV